MADGQAPLLAVLLFAGFAALVVLGPGVALQRLALRRWDPALVVPTGLLFAALAYWASLLLGRPLLFPLLVAAANAPLARRGLAGERARGPSLRGAIAPVLLLVALFGLTQYRVNRVASDGTFRLDLGEHIDTAVHVGLTWELVAGYPPQVPGLAGVQMRYHVGSHLVRAAAARWAGIHPYDSVSRFDVTLWAIGLVLVLRAAAQALGLGRGAVALAGYLPLVADLSWIPGAWMGSAYWAFKLGGNLVEAVFYANSIVPALALVLGALVCLARAERGEGRAWLALAAVLAGGAPVFKVFTGAQLLLALGTAWALRPARRRLLVLAVPTAAVLLLLVAGSVAPAGSEGVRASVSAFAPANPARVAFALPEVSGRALALSGLAWVALSLGVRILGLAPAARAVRGGTASSAVLGAFALWGWPLATFVSVKADPSYDESFYFAQAGGLALLLFAAPVLAGPLRAGGRRAPGPSRPGRRSGSSPSGVCPPPRSSSRARRPRSRGSSPRGRCGRWRRCARRAARATSWSPAPEWPTRSRCRSCSPAGGSPSPTTSPTGGSSPPPPSWPVAKARCAPFSGPASPKRRCAPRAGSTLASSTFPVAVGASWRSEACSLPSSRRTASASTASRRSPPPHGCASD